MEQKSILQDAIQQLYERNKNENDYYYLGQLYLMNNEKEKAKKCFEQSAYFEFSQLMLLSLGTKNIDVPTMINSLNLAKPDYEINCKEVKDLTPFQSFFHCFECQNILSSLAVPVQWYIDEPIFWKAFYLNNKSKEEIKVIVREFEAKEILQNIEQYFSQELKAQVSDKKIYLSNELDLKLKELSAFTNDLLAYLDRQLVDNRLDFGNQIGLKIEEWAVTKVANINPFRCYSLIIQYYFCKGNLSENQAFTVYSYLLHTLKRKNPNINIDNLIFDVSKTLASDLSIKLFFTTIKFVWDIVKENWDYETEKSDSDYNQFKKNLWKIIADDAESLSSKEFDKKYCCFDWLKANQT
jgi:hypothetical protein